MKLYEYEGKELFASFGLPIPAGTVAASPEEARRIVETIGGPVMIKAQVLTGGRGKTGGVKQADNPDEAKVQAGKLLGCSLLSHKVMTVLVEEKIPFLSESYISFVMDFSSEQLRLLFSPRGGVDVEDRSFEELLQLEVSVRHGPDWRRFRGHLQEHSLRRYEESIITVAARLFQCVRERDLLLGEINPLFLLPDGRVVAGDARVEVDDNALFRSPFFTKERILKHQNTGAERSAIELGLNGFVPLEGEVGVLASGAGLGMATMDLLEDVGLRPANFLDTGGGITVQLIAGALNLVLNQPGLRGILVNLYGGINSMVAAANGLIRTLTDRRPTIPVVVKLLGNEQEEAWSLLEAHGVTTVRDIRTEHAVRRLVELMEAAE